MNLACFGDNNGTATVNVNGGTSPYTYLWSNGDTTNTATGLSGNTNYTCIITDSNGCDSTATFNITEPSEIIITTDSIINVSVNCKH